MSYKDFITEVPNFPKDGIGFKDISPLLLLTKKHLGLHLWIWVDTLTIIYLITGLVLIQEDLLFRWTATYFGGGVVCRKEGKLPNLIVVNHMI